MTWSSEPPSMPVPGWYADPEQAWTWRWWDGVQWTDMRAPMGAPSPADHYSFSSWFSQSSETVKAVTRRLWLVVALACTVCVVAVALPVYGALSSDQADEIYEILEIDSLFDSSGSTVELSAAQEDRIEELLVDLAWPWIPVVLIGGVVVGLIMAWVTALVARQAHEYQADGDAARVPAGGAARRVPALCLSYLAVLAIFGGVIVACLLPLFIAAAADGDDGSLVLAGIFGIPGACVAGFFLMVRLSLALPLCAIGGHGLGLRRSWKLTKGHFWGTCGRWMVAGLIAGVITWPVALVANFGAFTGLAAMVTLQGLSQAISFAASTLITIPAAIVLAQHLEEQRPVA